jgi:hypothetical protein
MPSDVGVSAVTPSVASADASGSGDQTLTSALNRLMTTTLMMQIASDQNGPLNPANEAINESYSE